MTRVFAFVDTMPLYFQSWGVVALLALTSFVTTDISYTGQCNILLSNLLRIVF